MRMTCNGMTLVRFLDITSVEAAVVRRHEAELVTAVDWRQNLVTLPNGSCAWMKIGPNWKMETCWRW